MHFRLPVASASDRFRSMTHALLSSILVPLTHTSEIARALRCNPDYLGRVFRRAFGKALTEAIHDRRAYEACQLLQRSELNVNEVARACGWENLGHFRKVFTRHAGMSPSAYRQKHAGRRIGRRGASATGVSEYTIPAFEDPVRPRRRGRTK
jgi:AraC-like DNA-binding protein